MFGINGFEFVILAVLALVVVGPDKLPGFISDASRMVRQVRRMARDAQNDVREHLGPEFADIDLADLNPRSFVQKHLLDDTIDDDLRESARFDMGDSTPARSSRPDLAKGSAKGSGGATAMSDPTRPDAPGPDLTKPAQTGPAQTRPATPYDGDAT